MKPHAAFLHAELERVTGSPREARQLLLEAIGCAHDQDYTLLEGHLNECLGGLLREAGLGSAGLFLREAARLYRRCRAERKELGLVERHPEAFEEERAAQPPPPGEPLPPPTLPNLDVEYLMKSSSAISAEIALEAVLKKIMNVVLECSGAQYGCLLIEEDGVPVIRAESRVTGKQAARILHQRLEDSEEACSPIIRYVQRTGERVILSDAAQEGAFKDNPEVQGRQLRSVLCLPVIKQSRRIGILYLENRLSDAVFTPQKTQMTELLTSQAAISLENAILFQRQQEAEQALRDRESELRLITDAVPALIAYIDSGHRYLRINKTYERWLGITDEQARGRPVREILGEDNWQIVRPYQEQALRGERASFQGRMSLGEGEPRWVEAAYVPDHDGSGRVRGFVAHTVDIGGVKQAEEQVRRSLREKEALLKEIHHRVKNNLQIIHSMLNLQLPAIRDEQDSALFKESQNRIYSMALIHEKLYQSESLVMIDLAEYIRNLTANLLDSYGVSERAVHLEVSVERVTLGIDTVIPCALIINELVSNSLKHAFPPSRPDGRRGEIRVGLRPLPDGLFLLTVGDNGVGLPAGFELEGCRSLGLKLVAVLARQLRGTIRVAGDGGTEFSITFQPVKVKGGS